MGRSRLDGAVTWTVDGVDHELAAGEAFVIPRGGPPDRDAMFAVMRRHGLTPAVPAAS